MSVWVGRRVLPAAPSGFVAVVAIAWEDGTATLEVRHPDDGRNVEESRFEARSYDYLNSRDQPGTWADVPDWIAWMSGLAVWVDPVPPPAPPLRGPSRPRR